MTLRHELDTFIFIMFAAAGCMLAMVLLRNNFKHAQVVTPLPTFIAQATPTPTPIPSTTNTATWEASDGLKTITLKTTAIPAVSTTYAVSVSDANENTTPILSQTISGLSAMSIPFNAFSSSDTYLFLKQVVGRGVHFLVFKSSGQPFADGQNSLDVATAFAAYTSSQTLTDVTGWASDTLLIVNTKNADGSSGPSYWYDIESKSFIPLATVFQ